MNRSDFIRKGFLGTGAFLASTSLGAALANQIDEIQPLEILGFNHLPAEMNRMENQVLHKADTRGHANHGWLDSHHTFSFAHYYNPERMHFGALRVLNDDRVSPAMGFGKHPHDNMEIISIPLDGELEHRDSMGNVAKIRKGDIQVMSAGTGIFHSEYNAMSDKEVRFLQIWVFPNKRDVTPRYDQITLNPDDRLNRFQQILSPNADDEGVWIHQDAWFHLGHLQAGKKAGYELKKAGNGVYAFLLEGEVKIAGETLKRRDGFGIWDTTSFEVEASQDAEILLMEVPMTF